MNIGDAITIMALGGKVARQGWNGRGMFIEMQRPDEHSKMTEPYIYLSTALGRTRIPWTCSQSDLLATDWYEVK